jgi:hypothetical protein
MNGGSNNGNYEASGWFYISTFLLTLGMVADHPHPHPHAPLPDIQLIQFIIIIIIIN